MIFISVHFYISDQFVWSSLLSDFPTDITEKGILWAGVLVLIPAVEREGRRGDICDRTPHKHPVRVITTNDKQIQMMDQNPGE